MSGDIIAENVTGIRRLPVNVVEYEENSWKFKVTKSHILSSKCTSSECSVERLEAKCPFCIYTHRLDLPHLPDMVFNANVFSVDHVKGLGMEFNAFDSLALVSNGKQAIEVACSEEWREYRNETGHSQTILKPFDWTFSTNYMGSLKGNWKIEPTEEKINLEKLMKKDAILFFHELTLFEDELHDNGIAQLTIKVRVMPEVFFILLRYFLRVDNVLIKINDTRIYHEFNTNYLIREYTSREAKVSDLKVPPATMLDPNTISPHLRIVKQINEKLSLE